MIGEVVMRWYFLSVWENMKIKNDEKSFFLFPVILKY